MFLGNNKISRVSPGIGQCLPALESLVLTYNQLSSLEDLTPLSEFPNLERLCLLRNPVCSQPNYRLFVLHLLPKLKILDGARVKPAERHNALSMFGESSGPQAASFVAQVKKQAKRQLKYLQTSESDHETEPSEPETDRFGLTKDQRIKILVSLSFSSR